MSTVGDKKIIAALPEAGDLVSRAVLVGALQQLEDCAAQGIAVQANTSTTAYTTAFPFQEYYDGMRLLFVPRLANTGAVTLNINGLGAKKLCNTAGVQVSAAGAIGAYELYWIEYDPTLDGGAGAFRVYSASQVASGDFVSIAADTGPGSRQVSLALPYWAIYANAAGTITPANFEAHASTRLVGMHPSPGGGIFLGEHSNYVQTTWMFAMRVENLSVGNATVTIYVPLVGDLLDYRIDAGAVVSLKAGHAEDSSVQITIPTGVHTVKLFLRDAGNPATLEMADWLNATIVWAAGGVYY